MDEEDREELVAMVVGFLQKRIKENPNGMFLADFEHFFPIVMEETKDWYKRYKVKNALEALKAVPEVAKVVIQNGNAHISLNKKSDKVDSSLLSLISEERNTKKSSRRPSSRAAQSFGLNRTRTNNFKSNSYQYRLNHGQQYRYDNLWQTSKSTSTPSRTQTLYNGSPGNSSRMAAGDPRNRSSFVPPQVKTSSQASSISTSHYRSDNKSQSQAQSQNQSSYSSSQNGRNRQTQSNSLPTQPLKPQQISSIPIPVKPIVEKAVEEEDLATKVKKIYLRQRILSLLKSKFSEIKILFLSSLYQLEYDEKIDPKALGHPNLTTLLLDPQIKPYIQINFKTPFVTISAKHRGDTNSEPASNPAAPAVNGTTKLAKQEKLDAMDPFNIRTMMESLDPIGEISLS